jgi:endoglucanase
MSQLRVLLAVLLAGGCSVVGGGSADETAGGHADDCGDGPGGADGSPVEPGTGRFRVEGNRIVDAGGNPVRFTGVNWFGLETPNFAPHGLWMRSMDAMLDQVAALGFNVLRVPFSSQLLDAGSMPNGIDFSQNADLMGKSGLEIMDTLIEKAAARGLRVILDRHRPGADSQSELWYTAAYGEERWISDWVMLATRYRDNPAVIAFDLHNEPHGAATWGDGSTTTDWRAAATRAGDAILAANPDLLIVVEGVEKVGTDYYWWGGNLRGAGAAPVELAVPGRVVYSPHDYPASIYPQSWFSAPDYPANLPAVWDAAWGYLPKGGTGAILIGEFGTKYQTESDRQWLAALADYIADNQLSFTYWSLNPNSGDTGGILADDWVTVHEDKMAVIRPLLAPPLP